jgi:transposase
MMHHLPREKGTGASIRFLPADSPDLNPIEQVFAKLKALLRAMALRTVDALWKALGSIIHCVSPRGVQELHPPCRLCPVRVKTL